MPMSSTQALFSLTSSENSLYFGFLNLLRPAVRPFIPYPILPSLVPEKKTCTKIKTKTLISLVEENLGLEYTISKKT